MVEREASAGEDSFLAWNSLLLLSFLLCLEGEILLTFFASLVSRMKVNESVLRLKEKKTPSLDNDWQNPKHCCARVDTAAGVDIFPDFLNYFKMSVERFLTHLYCRAAELYMTGSTFDFLIFSRPEQLYRCKCWSV